MLDHKYSMHKIIGRGGSSNVVLVTDEDDRKFAAKIINDRIKAVEGLSEYMVCKENVIMNILSLHPNVLKTYSASCNGEIETYYAKQSVVYNIMEYAEHGSLSNILKAGPLSEGVWMFYLWQLISVISFMHENLMVHLDIKPGNILLDEYFNLKLADFGCTERWSRLGEVYERKGTTRFMAPDVEDFSLTIPFDGRKADVYSIGVTLFYMLYGSYPDTNDREEIKFSLSKWKQDVTIHNVVELMLSQDPADRWAAQEILEYWEYGYL